MWEFCGEMVGTKWDQESHIFNPTKHKIKQETFKLYELRSYRSKQSLSIFEDKKWVHY